MVFYTTFLESSDWLRNGEKINLQFMLPRHPVRKRFTNGVCSSLFSSLKTVPYGQAIISTITPVFKPKTKIKIDYPKFVNLFLHRS